MSASLSVASPLFHCGCGRPEAMSRSPGAVRTPPRRATKPRPISCQASACATRTRSTRPPWGTQLGCRTRRNRDKTRAPECCRPLRAGQGVEGGRRTGWEVSGLAGADGLFRPVRGLVAATAVSRRSLVIATGLRLPIVLALNRKPPTQGADPTVDTPPGLAPGRRRSVPAAREQAGDERSTAALRRPKPLLGHQSLRQWSSPAGQRS